MIRRKLLAWCAAVVCLGPSSGFSQADLAATPPMGWNSWNHFGDHVTDAEVRSAADELVRTGMRDAGYVYVNVDDTWQGKRDAQGVIHANERFPDMKALGDYLHGKGLKFGIYSSPGTKTCGGYAGSFGHEAQDAQTYAAWGVDFLKYDLCSFQDEAMAATRAQHPGDLAPAYQQMIDAYRTMGNALKATGRPIVYSLCQYGLADAWKWAPGVGAQMWRTTDDIDNTYWRMLEIGQSQSELSSYAGPGHWNDPDMLEIGNGKLTPDEDRAHMALWVLLAAPLLAGNDLTKMTAEDKAILTNKEAIAIDQDPLGRQGTRLYQLGDFSAWSRPLSGGRVAVGLFNASWQTRDIPFDLAQAGFRNGANLRDVWQGKDLGRQQGTFTGRIPKHGSMLLILSR